MADAPTRPDAPAGMAASARPPAVADAPGAAPGAAPGDEPNATRNAERHPEPSAERHAALGPDLAAALAAARARGQAATNPLPWRHIEALAQRTTAHQGPVRQLLEARLRALLAALPAEWPDAPHAAPTPAAGGAPARPLRELLARLQLAAAHGAGDPSAPPTHAEPAAAASAPPELKVVQRHRGAWARLRAEQRVAQAQTALPEQAGPLNSQRLLHRALTLMRETAPGYLQHFLHHAEALAWLEHAQAAPAAEPRPTARARAGKAAARRPGAPHARHG